MFLFWGVVGVVHALFLPGAALLSLLGVRGVGFRRHLVSALVLSLVVDYVLAMLLIGPGWYGRPALFAVSAASLLILLWKSRAGEPRTSGSKSPGALEAENRETTEPDGRHKGVERAFGILIAIAVVLIASFFHKTVFKSIDQIISWNQWAKSWAAGEYPSIHGDYPQLMPIIKSIPYIFLGTSDLPVFAIIALELLVVFFLVGLSTMADGPNGLRGVIVAAGGLFFWAATQVGLADAIVGLMALLAVVILYWANDERLGARERTFFLYLAFLAAGCTAVLKQSGPLWWPWFFLIALESLPNGLTARERAKRLLRPLLVSLALALPWYVFNQILIARGSVPPNLWFLLTSPEIYRGRTTFIARVYYALGHYWYYLVFLIPAVRGLRIAGIKMVSASAVFMMLAWLLFFSYSTRNMRFPVMLSLFALGAMIEDLAAKGSLRRCWARLSGLWSSLGSLVAKRPLATSLGVMAVIFAASLVAGDKMDAKLLEARVRSSLEIGETGLTKRIDWLQKRCPGRMLTADGRLRQLLSVDAANFHFGVPTDNFDPAEFQYLVLDHSNKARINSESLALRFAEDQSERRFTIYINKETLRCIYIQTYLH
jgi:hypothetical protein